MSNILIIKHGSLGDLIQANGAIQDIKNSHEKSKVILLTSKPYVKLMSECPYIDGVIEDKRLPRWNIFYLLNLKKLLTRYNFVKIFDLQNSSRTSFYKRFLLKKNDWSSSETSLMPNQKKEDFDNNPVLERMKLQLDKSNVTTNHIYNVDISWALKDLSRLIKQYANEEFILIFPFCSKKHNNKRWPYFKDLVAQIKKQYKNKYPILIAPGPDEIKKASIFNAKVILDEDKSLNLNQLITLINEAKYIIANDTGPAHIASHLKKKGLVLFGSHTTSKKVSIENKNFKAININNLSDLSVEKVLNEIKKNLD